MLPARGTYTHRKIWTYTPLVQEGSPIVGIFGADRPLERHGASLVCHHWRAAAFLLSTTLWTSRHTSLPFPAGGLARSHPQGTVPSHPNTPGDPFSTNKTNSSSTSFFQTLCSQQGRVTKHT